MKSSEIKKLSDKYVKTLWANPTPLNYLVYNRGLSENILRKYHIGYCNDGSDFQGYITIPIIDGSQYVNLYGRNLIGYNVPHRTMTGIPKSAMFNSGVLNKKGIIVVESIIDALSLIQNNFNACALLGLNIPEQVLEKFKGHTVFLLFDNDEAGRYATYRMGKKLRRFVNKESIFDVKWSNIDHKWDVNTLFTIHGNPVEQIKIMLKNSVAINFHVFGAILKNRKKIKNKKIDEKVDIVRVARALLKGYIDRGEEIWVQCPHHKNGEEKSRSLWIGGNRNMYYCFGCQRGGGVLDFVAWHLGISANDATHWLEVNGFL